MKLKHRMQRALSPLMRIAYPTPKRPEGVSLLIRSCNEDWIEQAITSTQKLADEVILADASIDDTPQRAQKTCERLGMPFKLSRFIIPNGSIQGRTDSYASEANIGLTLCSYRWVVNWDADFVAYTEGEYDISNLRRFLLSLNPHLYWTVNIYFYGLNGDLNHTIPSASLLRGEPFAFTWSPRLKWRDEGYFEALRFPSYYMRVRTDKYRAVHLESVKPAIRLLQRKYWTGWRLKPEGCLTLQEYIAKQGDDLKECWREYASRLKKRNFPLPKLLEGLDRYQMLYKGDKIVGRSDIGSFDGPSEEGIGQQVEMRERQPTKDSSA